MLLEACEEKKLDYFLNKYVDSVFNNPDVRVGKYAIKYRKYRIIIDLTQLNRDGRVKITEERGRQMRANMYRDIYGETYRGGTFERQYSLMFSLYRFCRVAVTYFNFCYTDS